MVDVWFSYQSLGRNSKLPIIMLYARFIYSYTCIAANGRTLVNKSYFKILVYFI
jgi:hypothetical protein